MKRCDVFERSLFLAWTEGLSEERPQESRQEDGAGARGVTRGLRIQENREGPGVRTYDGEG